MMKISCTACRLVFVVVFFASREKCGQKGGNLFGKKSGELVFSWKKASGEDETTKEREIGREKRLLKNAVLSTR